MHWTCEEIFQKRARGRRRDDNFKYIYNLMKQAIYSRQSFFKTLPTCIFFIHANCKVETTKNTPRIELHYVMSMWHDQSKARRNKRMHHFCQVSIKFTNINKLIHIATKNGNT